MRTSFHSYLRVLPQMAIGILICIGAPSASAAASTAAPAPAPVTTSHPGGHAHGPHKAPKAKVDVPRVPTKPQRPVKPLRTN